MVLANPEIDPKTAENDIIDKIKDIVKRVNIKISIIP